MMTAARAPAFLGRTSEREVLDRLLANVSGGRSAVLVIRGEAGIGKTAPLQYAARQASGFHVAQVGGVEAEMELPFAEEPVRDLPGREAQCDAQSVLLRLRKRVDPGEHRHAQLADPDGRPLAAAEWMRAALCNGLGRHDDALTAGERATRLAHELGPSLWALPELIEAAARTDVERAGDALERLTETTRASGGDWALGIEARSRALARTRVVVHLARAQLVYGEWLRREHRRVDARDQLRAAHETFSRSGAEAFAERARRELLATGERVRKRRADTRDGLSNPEIGARIFLSPRTVEWHLRKVFAKLEIRSRHELSGALPSSESEFAPA